MAAKIMGLAVYNVAWAEAYLATNWHLDPSSHLAKTQHDLYVVGQHGVLCEVKR